MWQIYERKVVVLTWGGLIFWKYLELGMKNASSDIRVKYQKSAEVILANWIYTICEGLNDRRIFFMKGNQKYDNGRQLHIEDYLQENKLETKGNVEVPSIFAVSSKEEIDTKTVTNELLEEILSKDNMNTAFKKVKANNGASGIDDMKVDELLQYLKENGKQIKEDIRNGKYNPKVVRRVSRIFVLPSQRKNRDKNTSKISSKV